MTHGASLYVGSSSLPVIQTILSVTAPATVAQLSTAFPGQSITGSVSVHGV